MQIIKASENNSMIYFFNVLNNYMKTTVKISSDCNNFLTLHEFYKLAKKNTSKETWDYIIGSSETETTYKRNRYK